LPANELDPAAHRPRSTWKSRPRGHHQSDRGVGALWVRLSGAPATAAAHKPAHHAKNEPADQAAKELRQRGREHVHRILRVVRSASDGVAACAGPAEDSAWLRGAATRPRRVP